MSAAQHTPGRWIPEHILDAAGDEATWAVSGLADAGNDTRTIALVGGPHAEADARLIATAPELLGLLQRGLCITGSASWETNLKWFNEARAAIAKATGSAS